MSIANIENVDVGGKNVVPTRRWNVAVGQVIFPGEPIVIGATRNYAIAAPTGAAVIGTDEVLGISQSAAKFDEAQPLLDGYVDIYIPTDAIWECKALNPLAVDTIEEMNALIGKRVQWNLTAGVYTIDTGPSYSNVTIAFVGPSTITDSANGFVTAGYVAGDLITISGSPLNNGTYEIATVLAGTITLVAGPVLINEAAGASIVTSGDNPANGLEIVGGSVEERSVYFMIRQSVTDLN